MSNEPIRKFFEDYWDDESQKVWAAKNNLSKERVPLIKGGQGRTDKEVEASANMLCWFFILASILAVAGYILGGG